MSVIDDFIVILIKNNVKLLVLTIFSIFSFGKSSSSGLQWSVTHESLKHPVYSF
jgi:hypothetical protein